MQLLYSNCQNNQICAYYNINQFLGVVKNLHKMDEKIQTEIITKKGYALFLDEEARELSPSYEKLDLLVKNWPIDWKEPSNLAFYLKEEPPSKKGTFHFTLLGEDGKMTVERVCYDLLKYPAQNHSYYELLRVGNDIHYPRISQYEWDTSSLPYVYKAIPVYKCLGQEAGIPVLGVQDYHFKNARGQDYYGQVHNGVCETGVTGCLT